MNIRYWEIAAWALLIGLTSVSSVASGMDFTILTPNDVRDLLVAFFGQGSIAAVGLIRMLNTQK